MIELSSPFRQRRLHLSTMVCYLYDCSFHSGNFHLHVSKYLFLNNFPVPYHFFNQQSCEYYIHRNEFNYDIPILKVEKNNISYRFFGYSRVQHGKATCLCLHLYIYRTSHVIMLHVQFAFGVFGKYIDKKNGIFIAPLCSCDRDKNNVLDTDITLR